MYLFSLLQKCDVMSRCALLAIGATALPAFADELPPFSPNSPPSASRPGSFIHSNGATLYRAVCQGCHMPDARGARGAGEYPALAGNPKLISATFAAARVLNGFSGMPRFADMLSDAQIAEVVNYVRTNFGNQYTDHLSAADIERMRVVARPR